MKLTEELADLIFQPPSNDQALVVAVAVVDSVAVVVVDLEVIVVAVGEVEEALAIAVVAVAAEGEEAVVALMPTKLLTRVELFPSRAKRYLSEETRC